VTGAASQHLSAAARGLSGILRFALVLHAAPNKLGSGRNAGGQRLTSPSSITRHLPRYATPSPPVPLQPLCLHTLLHGGERTRVRLGHASQPPLTCLTILPLHSSPSSSSLCLPRLLPVAGPRYHMPQTSPLLRGLGSMPRHGWAMQNSDLRQIRRARDSLIRQAFLQEGRRRWTGGGKNNGLPPPCCQLELALLGSRLLVLSRSGSGQAKASARFSRAPRTLYCQATYHLPHALLRAASYA